MSPDFSPTAFDVLTRASEAEMAAGARLAASVNLIAQKLVAALADGQAASGYRAADGLLVNRDGIGVSDSAESTLAFAQDLVSGLLGRMAHELTERAAAIERLALALDGAPDD